MNTTDQKRRKKLSCRSTVVRCQESFLRFASFSNHCMSSAGSREANLLPTTPALWQRSVQSDDTELGCLVHHHPGKFKTGLYKERQTEILSMKFVCEKPAEIVGIFVNSAPTTPYRIMMCQVYACIYYQEVLFPIPVIANGLLKKSYRHLF